MALNQALHHEAKKLRPFYFIVVAWGERFTLLLLDFCIASLLSPNNIPALLNSGNKFLIATTDEDWDRMQSHPIFQLLKQYVEPVFLRIPPFGAESNKYVHMGIGHKLATQMAYEHRAYGVVLTPDGVLSDGTMVALQRHAMDGTQVVLTAGLRFGEEPLLEHLKQLGVLPDKKGQPLVLTNRQLVWAAVRSFHSQMHSYEWESSCFTDYPPAVLWRVPGEDGFIMHSLCWGAPLLVDYEAIIHHDSSAMDNWTIDGDYVYRNFGFNAKMHIVQDSDELMLISWGPLAEDEVSLEPKLISKSRLCREWQKEMILHNTIFHPQMDLLKRQFFSLPVYWHAHAINEQWSVAEKRARKIINKTRFAGPLRKALFIYLPKWRHLIKRHKEGLGIYLKSTFVYYYGHRNQMWNLIKRALQGDSSAKNRIKRSLRLFADYLIGDPNKRKD